MKKVLTACLAMVFLFTVALSAFAQQAINRDAMKKRVDEIVTAINSGKTAADFKSAGQEHPPVIIMKTDGTMLITSKYYSVGQNIKEIESMYKPLSKADANGIWVTYWTYPGWDLNAYVRKTNDGLIVGCTDSE